ncbi:unnamed protein product, partial [Mesorhabditis belari]|uniref:Uncharacterized protein n=1 Tax=Mesorhabditis belari TaxID=2138241 RepID=A0AAF3FAS8_9BILA
MLLTTSTTSTTNATLNKRIAIAAVFFFVMNGILIAIYLLLPNFEQVTLVINQSTRSSSDARRIIRMVHISFACLSFVSNLAGARFCWKSRVLSKTTFYLLFTGSITRCLYSMSSFNFYYCYFADFWYSCRDGLFDDHSRFHVDSQADEVEKTSEGD